MTSELLVNNNLSLEADNDYSCSSMSLMSCENVTKNTHGTPDAK